MALEDSQEKPDRNDTGETYTYRIMWGWENDIRYIDVEGDSHYTGSNGLKVTKDGATVADFDRDAYRTFVRAPEGTNLPETLPESGDE